MATQTEIYNAWASTDGTVTARAHACCARYATYILGGGSADANRVAWAKATLADMPSAVARIRWGVAGDPNFIAAGAAIGEDELQAAVETAVNAIVPLAT